MQDINHLAYHGCELRGDEDGGGQFRWQSLHTTDGSGVQQWSRGAKRRFLHFYSLSLHFDTEVKAEGWRKWSGGDEGDGGEQRLQERLEEWRREEERWQRSGLSAEERVAAIAASNASSASAHSQAASLCTGRPVVVLNVMNHLMAPYGTNPHLAYVAHSAFPVFPGDRSVAEAFAQLAVRYKWTLFSFLPNALYCPLRRDMREERAVWTRLHHSRLLEGRHQGEGETGTGERLMRQSGNAAG